MVNREEPLAAANCIHSAKLCSGPAFSSQPLRSLFSALCPPLPYTDSVTSDVSTSPQQSIHRIVLTGFMGSGKSTVGPRLARALGWRFVDADEAIAAEAGMTIPEIFGTRGEAGFRLLEQQVIARLIDEDHLVLALGGGAIETEASRTLLLSHPATRLVHLEVTLETTLRRCQGTEGDRPVFADHANLKARYDRRLPLYRLAHVNLDANQATPAQLVERITADL